MEVDTSLEQEVSRNWSEIMKQFYVFDRQHKEVSHYHGDNIITNSSVTTC